MCMHHGLAILERHIADQRQDLHLFIEFRGCLVFLRLPVEPRNFGIRKGPYSLKTTAR
jgi:hypothetical protein